MTPSARLARLPSTLRLRRLGTALLLAHVGAAALPPARADVFQMPEGIRSLETVEVGDPGNPPDDTGWGAVPYRYRIGAYEVTTAQYLEFLNAKAKTDLYGLRSNNTMESGGCGILRQGEAGRFAYLAPPETWNLPVNHVSFWDACRFCNWLHNGQGDGDTEEGAYSLRGYAGLDGRPVRRNAHAKWFLPNEDEWYKAAYYDPQKPGGAGYWDYPTRSDRRPDRDAASPNGANWYDGSYLDPRRAVTRSGELAALDPEVGRYLTEAGAFAEARSGWGTWDQAGNVAEWTEGLDAPFLRYFWGGSCATADAGRNERVRNRDFSSQTEDSILGFRVAAAASDAPLPTRRAAEATPPPAAAVDPQVPRRPWRDPQSGNPYFPLAWFTWGSDEADLDAMAAEGVNTVLFVESPTDVEEGDAQLERNLAAMRAYLDHAQRRGIKVMIQCGWYRAFRDGDVAYQQRVRRYVEAVRDHPGLLGYQIYDEPEYKAGGGLREEDQRYLAQFVDALTKTRAAIRESDGNPRRTVQVVFNLVPLSSWIDYLPAIDAFQIDRYPCDSSQAYFGHRGDWGPLMMAWSIAHGAAALHDHPRLHNPAPCMQGVGSSHTEAGQRSLWRNPLYEETRYMAYSSLTAGGWGVFHWIRNASCPEIRLNVSRLYNELRLLMPALEQSFERPPFTVEHNGQGITRDFLADRVADLTTLALEDESHYYLIVTDNSRTFENVSLRLNLPDAADLRPREALVLHEDWSREMIHDPQTGQWVIGDHKMCFGDVNVWVIPKTAP